MSGSNLFKNAKVLAFTIGVLSFVFVYELQDSGAKSLKPVLGDQGSQPFDFDGECSELRSGENQRLKNIITQFGGTLKDPYSYPDTTIGFGQFISDSGVVDFSGRELVELPPADSSDTFELSRRRDALSCGLRNLMPPPCRWYQAAALFLVMQSIQREVGIQVGKIRHWYRPDCYNRARGGARSSDHRQARAIDFDFTYPIDRRKSQERLCHYFWKNKNLNIQVGRGCQTLHVGFESPRGRRTWTYASLFNQSCRPQQAPDDACRWVTGSFLPQRPERSDEDHK